MMNLKENKAITLLALVITIIVTMILVGVTLGSINDKESVVESARDFESDSFNTVSRVEGEIEVLYNELQNQT